MSKPRERKRMGRPPKDDAWDELLHVRVNRPIKDAIAGHRRAEMLASEADAVRDLLKTALRAKGLL